MTVYRNTAVHVGAAANTSVAQGRKFVETCAQLDHRMNDLQKLAVQVHDVNVALTELEKSLGLIAT